MKTPKQNYAKGISYGLTGSLAFATYLLINRYAYSNYTVNELYYTLTFLVAGGLFALIAHVIRLLNKADKIKIEKSLWYIALNGAIATVGIGLFVFGLGFTTAINTSILATSTVITTVIFARIMLKQKLNRAQIPWFVTMFAGFYIAIVGFSSVHLNKGDLIVISACLAMGFANTFSKILMKDYSRQFVADGRLISGGLLSLAVGLALGGSGFIVTSAWLWPVFAGFFFWLTIRLFYGSISYSSPTQAIILTNAHPIITPALGVVLLSEPYAYTKLLGSLILLVSIYFITKNRS